MCANACVSAAISDAQPAHVDATSSPAGASSRSQQRRQLLVPADDVRDLVAGLVDDRRRPVEVLARDLQRGGRADRAAVPEPQAGAQDRRAEPLVDVGEDRRHRPAAAARAPAACSSAPSRRTPAAGPPAAGSCACSPRRRRSRARSRPGGSGGGSGSRARAGPRAGRAPNAARSSAARASASRSSRSAASPRCRRSATSR